MSPSTDGPAPDTLEPGFYRALVDHSPDLVMVIDADGRVTYSSPTIRDVLGYEPEDWVGRPIFDLIHREDRAAQEARFAGMLEAPGSEASDELRMRHADGGWRVVHGAGKNLLDDAVVGGVLVHLRDVTAARTAAVELEDQLRQAQKMEAVGRLAGGIAHDFNNLLTAIGGYASLAADRSSDSQVTADLRQVVEAVTRARDLADKLLTFSRQKGVRLEAVDINAALRRLMSMLNRIVGEDVRLELNIPEPLWPAQTDTGMLEQAIVNIVVNARDAMPEGGELILETDRVTLDADRARALDAGLEAGDYVRLSVSDTGTGIDPAIEHRIFEPFFTTKEVGKGTGLGLAMVFGMIHQSGGAITVQSEPGSGTRFMLYLRRADPAPANGRERAPAPEAEAGTGVGGTVLIVEDEPAVLALARRVLAREGFQVLEAVSGEEARRVLEAGEQTIDLVLTDVIMPGMGGPELVQRLRRRYPGIRSLFMSGYAADELESRGLDREEENFLAKPFAPHDLAAAVRKVMERPGT